MFNIHFYQFSPGTLIVFKNNQNLHSNILLHGEPHCRQRSHIVIVLSNARAKTAQQQRYPHMQGYSLPPVTGNSTRSSDGIH